MIQANTVLEAWDKTFETMDFSHLAPIFQSKRPLAMKQVTVFKRLTF